MRKGTTSRPESLRDYNTNKAESEMLLDSFVLGHASLVFSEIS